MECLCQNDSASQGQDVCVCMYLPPDTEALQS